MDHAIFISDMIPVEDHAGDEIRTVLRPMVAVEYSIDYVITPDGVCVCCDIETLEAIRNDERFTEVVE